MRTRNAEGLWEPSIDLIGIGGLVDLGFGINDYGVIVAAITNISGTITTIIFFAAPISCFTQPLQESTSQRLL